VAPGRFAASIQRDSPEGCRIALIGLADDLGVRLNAGRPGARDGPRAFREALAQYGAAEPRWDWPAVFDAGDVMPVAGDSEPILNATHWRITEAAGALLDLGLLPVAIGGGHDLTFAFVRALAQRSRSAMGGVYFDAHLDVRPAAGSGMAFRRLVEDCHVRSLRVLGLSPLANTREHAAWFAAHGGEVVAPGSDGAAAFPPEPELFASFDLDVLDGSHAPGVSAVNPAGWSVREAAEWVAALGREPRVRCFDIMELNPAFDEGGRTARVAAHLFLCFLRGLVERPA
jgi:formiminoglutamase